MARDKYICVGSVRANDIDHTVGLHDDDTVTLALSSYGSSHEGRGGYLGVTHQLDTGTARRLGRALMKAAMQADRRNAEESGEASK